MMSSAQIAAKWARNLGAAGEAIKAGVQAVTTAPSAKAVANQAGYLAGVQASVGKWARNLSAVSLEDWRAAMLNKGVPHLIAGVTMGSPKVQRFMDQLLPYISNGLSTLASQPRGGLEANIARANTWMRYMAGFHRT